MVNARQNTSHPRGGWTSAPMGAVPLNTGRWVHLVAVICVAVTVTAVSARQSPGFETLDVVMTRSTFDEACELLNVDDAQLTVLKTLFLDYASVIAALDRDVNEQMLKAGLQELRTKEQSSPVGISERTDHDLELLHASLAARAHGLLKSDELLRSLIADFETVLKEEQSGRVGEILPLVRRRTFFSTAESAPNRADFRYVDPLQIIEDAMEPGEELEPFGVAMAATDHATPEQTELKSALAPMFAELSRGLDVAISAYYQEHRKTAVPANQGKMVDLENVDRDGNAMLRRMSGRWNSYYDACAPTMTQVENLASASIGPTAGADLKMRWMRAIAPNLMRTRSVDRAFQAVLKIPDVTDEQRLAILAHQQQYLTTSNGLKAKAFDFGLRAMRRSGMIGVPDKTYEEYVEATQSLDQHDLKAAVTVKAALTPNQAAVFDSVTGPLQRSSP